MLTFNSENLLKEVTKIWKKTKIDSTTHLSHLHRLEAALSGEGIQTNPNATPETEKTEKQEPS